eukprot:253846_1
MASFLKKRECGQCGEYLEIDCNCNYCSKCGNNLKKLEFGDFLCLKRISGLPNNQCQLFPIYICNNFVYFWFLYTYILKYFTTEGLKTMNINPFVVRFSTRGEIQDRLLGYYYILMQRIRFSPRYICDIVLPRQWYGEDRNQIKSIQYTSEIQNKYLKPLLFSFYAMDIFHLHEQDILNPSLIDINSTQVTMILQMDQQIMKKDTKMTYEWPDKNNHRIAPIWKKATIFADILVFEYFIRQIKTKYALDIPKAISSLCFKYLSLYCKIKLDQLFAPHVQVS